MRVLVTGAAGFIGSHLVRALLQVGHSVRAVDNLSTGQFWRIEDLVANIEWIEGDVCDPEIVACCTRDIDGVFHQAAIPSVSRSLEDPVASTQASVVATVTLLQACRQAGVRRLVYAASSSAYGTSPSLPKVETMCPAPLSPYAVSKLAAEQYCQVFARLGYVEAVCLRYFNVFGPRQDPASYYAAVIPKFATAILTGQPVTINGDGSQSRDFTYIDNVVSANMLALQAPNVSGEVMNVGCGERYDLLRLVEELGEIIGVEPEIQTCPSRLGDVPHSLADITKARTLLGYQPAVGFREGLERTVAWLKSEGLQRYQITAGQSPAA